MRLLSQDGIVLGKNRYNSPLPLLCCVFFVVFCFGTVKIAKLLSGYDVHRCVIDKHVFANKTVHDNIEFIAEIYATADVCNSSVLFFDVQQLKLQKCDTWTRFLTAVNATFLLGNSMPCIVPNCTHYELLQDSSLRVAGTFSWTIVTFLMFLCTLTYIVRWKLNFGRSDRLALIETGDDDEHDQFIQPYPPLVAPPK